MTELTSRDRLTRLFDGKEIDRVPIWLLAPYHRLGCYADIYEEPAYRQLLPYIERYCDTLDRRGFSTGFCYNGNPEIKTETQREADGSWTATVRYRDLCFQRGTSYRGGHTTVRYCLESAEELQKILEIPYQPPVPDISRYWQEKEELGSRGMMMIDAGDPLGPLYHLMSAEEFSVSTITDYPLLLDFLDEMSRRVLAFYQYLLERDIGEVFFIVGAEFAGPPLVNPARFREMSVRYVKRIVDLIRSYGKKSIVHYHGQLYDILDGIREVNPDGLHTIEAPPIGNCTISQARQALGDMILIGNIQYDDLVRLNPEKVRELTRQAVEEGKSGRFILSPSAGPYDPKISPHTIENYRTFIETGIRYGALK